MWITHEILFFFGSPLGVEYLLKYEDVVQSHFNVMCFYGVCSLTLT